MKYRRLGASDLTVSEICLGSMTWGTQNTEAEGHAQIDLALENGVTFIDTAEVYPVNPVSKETAGRSEAIIGSWIAAHPGRRADLVLATKVAGAGQQAVHDGVPITPEKVRVAIDGSLKRLSTDVIDLYQFHWPNRGHYHFRSNWRYDPSKQDTDAVADNMAAVMGELQAQKRAGKIRHFGLSNETAWGVMAWNRAAADAAGGGLPVVTIQNEYSLVCRHFDLDLAEVAHHERVPLLAYSPLAAGLLTGKYAAGVAPPKGSRRDLNGDLGGRVTPRVWPAVDAYLAIARRHGLSPVQMALAWLLGRPFLGAAIIGATATDQVALALGAADISLGAEVTAEIGAAWKAWPDPY
jgi:aryl-alcohol dehydrogenase-like predicted oxidoreductase